LLTVREAEYGGGLLMFGVPPVIATLGGVNPRRLCDTVVSDWQIPYWLLRLGLVLPWRHQLPTLYGS